MKKIINTLAQYVANLTKVVWLEVPAKRAAKVVKTIFKAVGGAIWEVTANVKDGAVIANSVAIQGLLF